MSLIKRRNLDLADLADLEFAAAQANTDAANIEDLTAAIIELGEIIAEQDAQEDA